MQEPARWAAAIEIVDQIISGQAADAALINWARSHRFAGSKDRAAIRDLVFDVLRRKRSCEALGGGATGRAALIGLALLHERPFDQIFNGEGYAPAPLGAEEIAQLRGPSELSQAENDNIPDWLISDLSEDEMAQFSALNARAPIDLRVNLTKATSRQVVKELQKAGHDPKEIDGLQAGLRLPSSARGLRNLRCFEQGWFEFQDAGAQRLIDALDLSNTRNVLDYCAGGGGKSLALAGRAPDLAYGAYDIDRARLGALEPRAKRAGAKITLLDDDPVGRDQRYDLVILDVPCSGSGAWRRNPDGKWALSKSRWDALVATQAQILDCCCDLVADHGQLVYMTCSIFARENGDQIERFLKMHPDFQAISEHNLEIGPENDGFFAATVKKRTA